MILLRRNRGGCNFKLVYKLEERAQLPANSNSIIHDEEFPPEALSEMLEGRDVKRVMHSPFDGASSLTRSPRIVDRNSYRHRDYDYAPPFHR